MKINIGTSFSGIGAPEQALKKLGVKEKILFAGDIDPYCKEAFFSNYQIKEANWHSDIRQFSAKKYAGKLDLFVGGSPCQSFSIMGKRKGLDEARGTLFYEYARVVSEANPKVFVFENVTGILNHDGGRTWKIISEIFNSLGYYWTLWNLNAKDFGVPQNRRRVFVVGFRKDFEDLFKKLKEPEKIDSDLTVESFLEKNVPNKYYLPEKGFLRVINPAQSKHVALNGKIARCQVACQQYNWFGDMRFETKIPKRIECDSRIYKGIYKGLRGVARTLTPRECLRLMGFPDKFKIVVNDTQAYRQAGNSMAVNVVSKVIESIINTGIFGETK